LARIGSRNTRTSRYVETFQRLIVLSCEPETMYQLLTDFGSASEACRPAVGELMTQPRTQPPWPRYVCTSSNFRSSEVSKTRCSFTVLSSLPLRTYFPSLENASL